MTLQEIDRAVDSARDRAEQWNTIKRKLVGIKKTAIDRVGEDNVTDSDVSYYRENVKIVIEARTEKPTDGLLGLMESVDWDGATMKQKRDGYWLRVEKRVRGN
jgi:hypothetical protein